MLIRVETPHFIAGLAVDACDVITHATPDLAWCIGKSARRVAGYFLDWGWTMTLLPDWEADAARPDRAR